MTSKTITVNVTQRDIKYGDHLCTTCPVARAIKRRICESFAVSVTSTEIQIWNQFAVSSPYRFNGVREVWDFVTLFDDKDAKRNKRAKPFIFRLAIPVELLKTREATK